MVNIGKYISRWPQQSSRGAAITEFALVAPIFLLLLFSVFQIGLTFHRFHLLTYTLNNVTRELAVYMDSHRYGVSRESNLEDKARDIARQYLANFAGSSVSSGQSVKFNASVSTSSPCYLRLTADWSVPLLGISFFPAVPLRAMSDTYIEDKLYSITSTAG